MNDARKVRENRRDTYTALVTFVSLVVASTFDFRDDVELLVAFQGALTSILHRVRT